MIKIRIKLGSAELLYQEDVSESAYPRIVSPDAYMSVTKSERMIDVVSAMCREVKSMAQQAQEL